jgi:hypothetical protein
MGADYISIYESTVYKFKVGIIHNILIKNIRMAKYLSHISPFYQCWMINLGLGVKLLRECLSSAI